MFKKVQLAKQKLEGIANHTPVMTSRFLNSVIGGECYFKCENFQRVGAFKFRGAWNAINCLTPEEARRGVITHSSGNHGQAVALASRIKGIKSIIVMPTNAPNSKVEATKNYGAEIIFCHPSDRLKATEQLIKRNGYTFIHPSNDLNVIYGQGTAAYELMEEVWDLDYVLAPVGGGGLLSGTCLAVRGLSDTTRIFGVEPENADDAFRSLAENRIVPSENPQTIADGLRTSLGSNTFKIIRKYAEGIITVSEKEIIMAMRFLWERMKIVVEPSGAVSLAALLKGGLDVEDQRIGIILSGGNIDLTDFFELLIEKTSHSVDPQEKK